MSRKSRRKNLQQIVALLVAVVVVVIASVAFQRWWNNRPGPEPKDVAITVTVNGTAQTGCGTTNPSTLLLMRGGKLLFEAC